MLKGKFMAYLLSLCMIVSVLSGINLVSVTQDVQAAANGFTQNDFLKCSGTEIKNNYGKGNSVYLRGTNAGGLFVKESWQNATNARDQKTELQTLINRFGETKAYQLLELYKDNFWTEADFDNCKEMGMSVIRVPFTYMNLYKKDASGNWVLRSDAFTRLDWFVEKCSERGIYVILDLHGAFGSQNGQDHSGEVIDNVSDVTFFSNTTLQNQTLELWKTVARHYAGNPAVAGYDTLNEPGEKAGSTGSKHWEFYNKMYNAIRSVDADHIIIMESCWGTGNLPKPSTYGWTNVMYEYHHYPWSTQNDTAGQKAACDSLINSINNANYNVPTYIGEYSCFEQWEAWSYEMEQFNKAGLHYTSWNYKTTNSGSWGIYNEKTTDKVDVYNDSESTIRTKWGANSVGTGSKAKSGNVYNAMKAAMPGTVVYADKALTDSDYFTIKANINSKYVTAENYGASNLVANRDGAGGWEQFRIIPNSDGTYSFQSRANNRYLCAVFDDTDSENPIIARSNKIGTWEKFYIEKQSDGSYALKTYVNNYYVQADINDATGGILHAYGASVGTWERFTIASVSGNASIPTNTQGNVTEPVTEAPTTSTPEANTNVPTTSGKYGNNFRAVAYYPNWYGDYTSKVQWDKLTHVYYAFALPNRNGTLDSVSGSANVINSMIRAAHNNDVKAILSVGGWSYSDGTLCQAVFEQATNTDAKCQSLANSIIAVVDQYGFDGADIDWEYPTTGTSSQYTAFIKYLRNGLTQRGKELTAAVAATSGSGYSAEALAQFDFINIMAYDGDNGAGHSPYSLLTNSFTYWNQTKGVPASKIVLGVPFYERPNWASYADVVAANSANAYKDSAVVNGTTVYYNGINTMKQKATYAAQNAGGIMIWEISQDSQNASLSLLNAIYDAATAVLGKGNQTVVTEPETEKPNVVNNNYEYTNNTTRTTLLDDNKNISNTVYKDFIKEAGVTATSSTTIAGNDAKNAIDENVASRWESAQGSDNESITIDLGAQRSIKEVDLIWELASASKYKVQVSSDGINYTDAAVVENGAAVQNRFDTVTLKSLVKARYVKILGVNRSTPYGYSIYDIAVYGVSENNTATNNENQNQNTGNQNAGNQGSTVSETINLAKNAKADASGAENDVFAAKYAVDGDEGTRWSSNYADNAWISLDLGNIYSINKVVLKWEGAYGKDYDIQVSADGVNYTTVKKLTNQNGGTDEITFNATSARYVKLQGVTRALPYGYSLWEMEVYPAAGGNTGSSTNAGNNSGLVTNDVASGTNVAKSKTADASGAENDVFAAKYAVDGDEGTRWSSNFADNAWISVDLGKTYAINKVVLKWEGAYGKDYDIQVSTDGVNYTTVKKLTNQDGGTDEISFDTVNARYVKLQGVTRALPYGYSLWEMQVLTK